MSTFSRFCALCHFDLNFLRADKVTAGYTKSSGSNLFDRRAPLRIQSFQALTTFTGIGFTM